MLVFSLTAESVSSWKAMAQVNSGRGSGRGSLSLWRWMRDTRQSELLVVGLVGEDIAATAGLAFALLAVAAIMVTGNPVVDAIGSQAIGVLLLGVAVFVDIEVKVQVGQSTEPSRRQLSLLSDSLKIRLTS